MLSSSYSNFIPIAKNKSSSYMYLESIKKNNKLDECFTSTIITVREKIHVALCISYTRFLENLGGLYTMTPKLILYITSPLCSITYSLT